MTSRQWSIAIAVAYISVSAPLLVARQASPFRVHPAPQWACEEEMHEYYIRRFESADGFGLARMPQPPMLDRAGVLEMAGKTYAIERLELVGLLKADTPQVYVPLRHNLPFRAEDFRSRSLTPFEQDALSALRAGRDIVRASGQEPGTLEIVGALRGDGSCLKCHRDVTEGQLLGAFSYTLRVKAGEGPA
jgi:hypothetical protein